MFRPALMLARHRGLVDSEDPALAKQREAFAEELGALVGRIGVIAEMARAQAGGSARQ
jgi:hypothetical protein